MSWAPKHQIDLMPAIGMSDPITPASKAGLSATAGMSVPEEGRETMKSEKSRIIMTVSMLALATAAPGHAQSAAPAAVADTAAAPDSQDQQGASTAGIADIVVTAQKRSENLQRTPAAITAVTGVQLTQGGITDLRAVQAIVPGARFQQEGNSTQVFLRGVGSNLDYGNIEPSVSFLFNGIFIPREGTSVPLFDIERLEALPGPQGTLYGRSAIGGTVNVTFQRPTHTWQTSGVIEAGNYNLGHISIAQNIPLSQDLAIRAAVDYTYHDGYMESGADSKNDLAGRLSLLYDPTPDFKLYMWGYATYKFGHPSNLVNKGYDPKTGGYDENAFLRNRPWDDLRPGALAAFAPFGQPKAPEQTYHNIVGGAQLDIGLGHGMTLTYTPGYFWLNSATRGYWLGGIPASISQRYHEVTQELRLSGNSSRLKWLAGLYGYHVVNGGEASVLVGTPFVFDSSHVLRNRLEGIAGFGQATYSITDRLRATVGGRYGIDNRHGRGVSLEDQTSIYTFAKTFRRFDYKIGAEYDLSPAILAYATYQTGYQPGTYNEVVSTPARSNEVKTATLNSISGGIKARLFDNRLQINSEIFYYIYHNLFIQSYDASKAYNEIFNAKKVTIPGVQLDIVYKPTSDDQFSGSVGYLHARNKNFVTPEGQSFNGLLPPYAADWTVSGSYAHDFHLASGYIRAEADARFESKFYADYVHNLGTEQKAAIKENAAITYYAESGKWNAGVWIKNISNKAVLAATAAAGIPGPATAYLEDPRTFGGRVGFKF